MRVSANHETAGKRVVLENNLMDDTRTRPPETEAVLAGDMVNKTERGLKLTNLCRGSSQKVIYFLVDLLGTLKILDTTHLCLNQVVTVNSGRYRRSVHAGRHELQQCHLCIYISSSRAQQKKSNGRCTEEGEETGASTDLRCCILTSHSL